MTALSLRKPSGASLKIRDLHVRYRRGTRALRGITLDLAPGSNVALVGESGCGKTTVARTLLGLLPADTSISGTVEMGETVVLSDGVDRVRDLLGRQIGYVAQNPFGSMNPMWSVGRNVEEAWRALGRRPRGGEVAEALARQGIADPVVRARQRPYEWSGGMLQRAAIAAAVAHQPSLIVADEPTSALDHALADQIMEQICSAASTVMVITHDIDVVAPHVDRIVVLYAGRIVEDAPARTLLARPRHPYTAALLAARMTGDPDLAAPLSGTPPDLRQPLEGCSFVPRCPVQRVQCGIETPEFIDGFECHFPVEHEAGQS